MGSLPNGFRRAIHPAHAAEPSLPGRASVPGKNRRPVPGTRLPAAWHRRAGPITRPGPGARTEKPRPSPILRRERERKSVESGKRESVREEHGGRRLIEKNKNIIRVHTTNIT